MGHTLGPASSSPPSYTGAGAPHSTIDNLLVVCGAPCRCQNRWISSRGSRTVRLRSMVTGDRGHDVYPGSGPLYGGNTLLLALLILMNMSVGVKTGGSRVGVPNCAS